MDKELIGQLISAGVGTIMALVILAVVWRLPAVLRELNSILSRIFDAADDGAQRLGEANTSLSDAVKILRDTTREAIDAKTKVESEFAGVVARLAQVERELQTEREKREALERELANERKSRQEDRNVSQKQLEAQAAKIRVLEGAAAEKDRMIEELKTERGKLLERVEALEKAQPPRPEETAKAA